MKKLFLVFVLVMSLFLVSCVVPIEGPGEEDPVELNIEIRVIDNPENSFYSYSEISSLDTTFSHFQERLGRDHLFGFEGLSPQITIEDDNDTPFTVQANHIAFAGDYAFISYNNQGETKMGAIDVFDFINDEVKRRIEFVGMDVNYVMIDGTDLVFAGSTIIDGQNVVLANRTQTNGITSGNSETVREDLANLKTVYTQPGEIADEAGIVLTSVSRIETDYYFSLANVGGKIIKTNNGFNNPVIRDYDFVKNIQSHNGHIYALSISETDGNIFKFDSDLTVQSTFTIKNISNDEAKATLAIFNLGGDTIAAYSREANGFEVVNLTQNGAIIETVEGITVNGLSYCNVKELLFISYREPGKSVGIRAYALNEENDGLVIVGNQAFSEKLEGSLLESGLTIRNNVSSNFVIHHSEKNKVLAATGKTGVFVYDFVEQNTDLPVFEKEDLQFGHLKLLPVRETLDGTPIYPEITLDIIFHFKEADHPLEVGIWNYYGSSDLEYTWEQLKTNDNYTIKSLFNLPDPNVGPHGELRSFTANFVYLGFWLENHRTNGFYTNYPGIGDADNHIKMFLDETGNNGKGEIIVGFEDATDFDYNDVVLVIRAYYYDGDTTRNTNDLFEIIPYDIENDD